jgi:flagellar protein FlgJ
MQGLMQYGVQQAVNDNIYNQMFGGGQAAPPPAPSLSPSTAAGTPQPTMAPYGQSQSGLSTMPDTSSHQAFVQSMLPVAKQWEQQTGIPASVFLAININEGNWGNAGTEMFGIKGSGNAGSANSPTWESVNGQHVNTNADFAQYKSPNDSYQGFWDLVSTSPRYKGAMDALSRGDTAGFLQGLVNGGYATDPAWAQKIMSIANTTVAPMIAGQ